MSTNGKLLRWLAPFSLLILLVILILAINFTSPQASSTLDLSTLPTAIHQLTATAQATSTAQAQETGTAQAKKTPTEQATGTDTKPTPTPCKKTPTSNGKC
jgi:hypothetical protein